MILLGAVSRGLTRADLDHMTLGQLVDYCITYNDAHANETTGDAEPAERRGTGDDLRRILG